MFGVETFALPIIQLQLMSPGGGGVVGIEG